MSANSLLIWRSLSGLAFFLLGMNYLEGGLKQLAGRKFKLFIRKQSTNKISAIGSAALVTGIMQSSSVVNLMILAFVGAGITGMQHALALMLGTNLGTTLDTWFVATVGFKVNMESYALPIIAISGISSILLKKNSVYYSWSQFLLGLGFVFLGLDLMKTGIGELVTHLNLSTITDYPAIVFLLIGLAVTGMIQSSSATIAITLSALHANALTLYEAMAIVLGSEIGTTLKLIIASVNGSAVKKRVALGNFIYNLAGSVLIFSVLTWVNKLIVQTIGIKDPLIALSFFQTFVNLVSIVLFFPLLNISGKLLERLYTNEKKTLNYITNIPPTEVVFALDALQKEIIRLLNCVIAFSCKSLEVYDVVYTDLPKEFSKMPVTEQYDFIKQAHGDILIYCIKIQDEPMQQNNVLTLSRLMTSAGNAIYAAKNIKDALPDIDALRKSGNETKYQFYLQYKAKAGIFYNQLAQMYKKTNLLTEEITTTNKQLDTDYTTTLKSLYAQDPNRKLSDIELSTIINFNREIYTSFNALLYALKDALIEEKSVESNNGFRKENSKIS